MNNPKKPRPARRLFNQAVWSDLIEGGFLAQTLLVVFIWGAIVYLAIREFPIPDALLDAGFVIVGFYFRSAISQIPKPPTGG